MPISLQMNNAGTAVFGTLEQMTMDDYDKVFNSDVRSVVVITRLCIPHLKKSKGRSQRPTLLL